MLLQLLLITLTLSVDESSGSWLTNGFLDAGQPLGNNDDLIKKLKNLPPKLSTAGPSKEVSIENCSRKIGALKAFRFPSNWMLFQVASKMSISSTICTNLSLT